MLDDNSATEDSIVDRPVPAAAGRGGAGRRGGRRGAARRPAETLPEPAPAQPPTSPAIGRCASSSCRAGGSTGWRSTSAVPQLAGRQKLGPVRGAGRGLGSTATWSQLSFDARYEASTIAYLLEGESPTARCAAPPTLGAASDQNHGIVNRSQFGPARWHASRVG